MKITDLKATVIEGNFDWAIVRVDTDEGISGYGESRNHLRGDFHGYTDPKVLFSNLRSWVIGEDPTDFARVYRKIRQFGGTRRRGGGVSALEVALWDITGKAYGVPVHKLLGGKCRDRIRVYCDCRAGRTVVNAPDDYRLCADLHSPEAYAKNAARIQEMGFTMLKFDLMHDVSPNTRAVASLVNGGAYDRHLTYAGIEYHASIVEAIRAAIQPETELALDCDFPCTISDAIRFARRVEKYGLAWIEDIMPDTDVAGYRRLSDSIGIPTLTGENLYGYDGFKNFIEQRAVGIVAPDLGTVGGIGELKRVAEMAEANGIEIAPHCSGSPLAFLAAAQVAATLPNLVALEFHSVDIPWWDSLANSVSKPLIENGWMKVPDLPGIGFEPNREEITKRLKPGETFFE